MELAGVVANMTILEPVLRMRLVTHKIKFFIDINQIAAAGMGLNAIMLLGTNVGSLRQNSLRSMLGLRYQFHQHHLYDEDSSATDSNEQKALGINPRFIVR